MSHIELFVFIYFSIFCLYNKWVFLVNSIGAQRVKNGCIAFRNFCEEQNVDGWVILLYLT